MNRSLVGKILHLVVHRKDHRSHFVLIQNTFGLVYEAVDIGFGQAIDFTQFAQDATRTKGTHCPHQGSMPCLVAMKNILIHFISVLPTKVYIKIGRRLSFGVQKSFEIQIQFDRTNIGNTQAISHNTIGTTAPPHIVELLGARISAYIIGDEKIRRKMKCINNLQFFFNTLFS